MTFSLIIVTLAFFAGFLLIVGVNLIIDDMYRRDQRRMAQRLQEQLVERERQRARDKAAGSRVELSKLAEEVDHEAAAKKPFLARLNESLEQSGLEWQVRHLVIGGLILGLLFGGVSGLIAFSPLVGLVVGLLASTIPYFLAMYHRQRRLNRLRTQLPDVLDLMSRILRAGQTITQAMQSVSKEFKPPIALEFAHCYEQQNLGLGQELALRDLARRTGLLEIKIFVLALLVQRRTGGNLAEMLDNMSSVVRERFKIRGKIRALTAEGRLQAVFLLALPPVMFVVLLLINYSYAAKLFDYPALIVGSLIWMTLGAYWIRRIVNFDF